jgi:hypothetical protein
MLRVEKTQVLSILCQIPSTKERRPGVSCRILRDCMLKLHFVHFIPAALTGLIELAIAYAAEFIPISAPVPLPCIPSDQCSATKLRKGLSLRTRHKLDMLLRALIGQIVK